MTESVADISRHVWQTKYRSAEPGEGSIADTWRRVAHAIAAVERSGATEWEERFLGILKDFKFLPGGRILAGAGTGRTVTLFNCFVMGLIEDSIPGIFRALEEGAVTMQQGGGIGYDFSTLRPRGTAAKAVGGIASGPVSFMRVWDAMCATILSTGRRRGAMMATLRCDHPDIEEFIFAKQQPGQLRRFNLSVQVTDAFMTAVRKDADWPLVFPAAVVEGDGETLLRHWPGANGPVPCRVIRRTGARRLWELIVRASYDYAEPGVLFVDRINRLNNLWYREQISATNPCGEIPLPAYGACDLGSLNLTQFVLSPFTADARLDTRALADAASLAVRMLDDVIDASGFPLPQQAESALASRRIGLGVTGLADALVMLGQTYGGAGSLALAADVMRLICHAAYRASISLAVEKGSFPAFDRDRYLDGAFVRELPNDIRAGIASAGIRNSHLLAIAPAGTISLLAGNVSSGLEPIFAADHTRHVFEDAGSPSEYRLTDYAVALWRKQTGAITGLPPSFISAGDISVSGHLDMQGALQRYVDNSISKTINVPEQCSFADFRSVFDLSYDKGLKGCTAFRPNPVTGMVLSELPGGDGENAPHCCVLEREAD